MYMSKAILIKIGSQYRVRVVNPAYPGLKNDSPLMSYKNARSIAKSFNESIKKLKKMSKEF